MKIHPYKIIHQVFFGIFLLVVFTLLSNKIMSIFGEKTHELTKIPLFEVIEIKLKKMRVCDMVFKIDLKNCMRN